MRHIGEKMILLLCIAVFGIAAVKLIDIGKEYYDGQKEYKELKAYIKEVPVCQPEKMTGDEPEKETGKEIDFEGLRKINEDLVAWIQIPGIGVDYPVVQGEDNEYYLYHTFQKENNKAGSIFLDYRNHDDFTDRRVILYGHNMKDGSILYNDEQDEIIFPMMEPKEVRSKPFYSDAKRSKIVCEKTPNTGFDSLVAASYPFAA